MKWREILITALLTLVVTIIGGVVVYWITSSKPQNAEKLIFKITPPVSFNSNSHQFCIYTADLWNGGSAGASDVLVATGFRDGTEISDYHVEFSSKAAELGHEEKLTAKGELSVSIPRLLSGEHVTVTLLCLSDKVSEFYFDAQSSGSSAIKFSEGLQELRSPEPISTISRLTAFFGLALQVLALILVALFRTKIRRLIQFSSVNNAAFLYLHKGMLDEAGEMLKWHIRKNGGTSFELSNYALYLGLKGSAEESNNVMSAARFYAKGSFPHTRALIDFNEAILSFRSGNVTRAEELFKSAMKLSKSEISEYSSYSKWTKEIFQSRPEFEKLFSK